MKKIQLLALVTGLITFFLVFTTSTVEKRRVEVEVVKKQVIAAAADIIPYTEITQDMLKVVEVEELSVHPNAVTEMEDVVGKISTASIFAQEQMLSNKISDRETASAGLSMKVTPGKRAITILVGTDTGVANNLRVGNWIDIITSIEVEAPEEVYRRYNELVREYPEYFNYAQNNSGGDDSSATPGADFDATFHEGTMLLQNVKILAIDSNIVDEYIQPGEGFEYQTVTLEVEPREALIIDVAEEYGTLRLILREQSDHEILDVPAVESRELLYQGGVLLGTDEVQAADGTQVTADIQGEVN